MHAKVVRYFVEVVRAGSIRKAAEQLHVVPTAVNRQILNLEEELGAPLFERIHNTLKLTPVGEIVLAHARSTLRDFDAVRQRIEEVRGLREGEASLATMAGLAGAFLPTVTQRFRAAHPGIRLTLLDLPIAEVLRSVRDGDADLGLAYDVPDSAGFRTLFTSEWPIGAVVPPGHPLTARATTVLSECVGHPLILPAASLSLRPILDGAFRRSAISVAPVIETTSTALMRRLVVQGVGITLLNRLDIDEERRAGSLVFVPLRDAGLSPQTLRLVMRAGGEPEPAATLLAGLVIRCLDDLLAP
ncbi:LysR substrate-binding domain-containing protein [Variovorax sp. J31P207]|uniref:LysR substrate-binding domain-containing protein n=1 Tax=Variovorax sp. J31P207 TaxID=3053510 RepID=UPI0025776330|nr:LysR substrate-binding domain-containing protein [Variovorax sp. J31P207]MDM0067133.1 LysR substrate-binding domain-containing protein [Variovorax sp. J31P207]